MKCKSYSSFSNRVTRRINILFGSQRMRLAMAMAQWSYECDVNDGNTEAPMPIDRLKGTVDAFGSDAESRAYEELVALMNDNPTYKQIMNKKTRR